MNTEMIPQNELERDLKIKSGDKYALVTYHPATLANGAPAKEIGALLDALEHFPDTRFIITGSNADAGGHAINKTLKRHCDQSENCSFFISLGSRKYISAMRNARAVIGNSSSGLYEAPVFGVPVVNIGDRQRGRLGPDNVINCAAVYDDIVVAMKKAFSNDFLLCAKQVKNPYGEGLTSMRILEIIKKYLYSEQTGTVKKFYQLDF